MPHLQVVPHQLRGCIDASRAVGGSGLRVVVGSARPAAVRGMARMALPAIEDARSLSTEEIQAEMATAKKDLFELRKKVKTRQQVRVATCPYYRVPSLA